MKILSVKQIRDWDSYTIHHKNLLSLDLMEDAANACVSWIGGRYPNGHFTIFCGKGNNGGDGLAIARLLNASNFSVDVLVVEHDRPGSPDFEENLRRLEPTGLIPAFIRNAAEIPALHTATVIIDAIFGSGLNRAAENLEATVIQAINEVDRTVISIDLPSGLFTDRSSKGLTVVKATHTLTFQCLKKAFLMAENEPFIGEPEILDIGLLPSFLTGLPGNQNLADQAVAASLYKPRKSFGHKGNFGHVLLLCGSQGKMGAAVLAARSAVHTGSGLVTAFVPECGTNILQVSIPEVMCLPSGGKGFLEGLPEDLSKYDAIGAGPGIGKDSKTVEVIRQLLLQAKQPIVLDADALNIISENRELLSLIPKHSILTPHPKEFERLFGATENEFLRTELAVAKSVELELTIVLKGHHTQVSLPDGSAWFNSTGNSGMAKGGSGDTLTGIITSLAGQGYLPSEAAIFGVYLHGLAGDIAASSTGAEAMLPTDLIACLGKAFGEVKRR